VGLAINQHLHVQQSEIYLFFFVNESMALTEYKNIWSILMGMVPVWEQEVVQVVLSTWQKGGKLEVRTQMKQRLLKLHDPEQERILTR
jgi:hypothetical protein